MKAMAWLACLIGLLLASGLIAVEGRLQGEHLILLALAFLCGIGAALGIVYTVLAGALIGRFFARTTSEPTSYPAVTIVKPLHGHEWTLLSNLSSFCQQDYPGPLQFLFGVHDSEDPALQTVEQLRLLHPQAHITVVADARLYGPNRKMSNILNMLPEAQHDVLVFADSDVSVGPSYLRNVVGELQKPGVGLVTCVYRGQPDPGFWPRLSAKATNYQFLPGVVTGLALGMARPCFGRASPGGGSCDWRSGAHDRREGGDSAVHGVACLCRDQRHQADCARIALEPDHTHHRPDWSSGFRANASARLCVACRGTFGWCGLGVATCRGSAARAARAEGAIGSRVAASASRPVAAAVLGYRVVLDLRGELLLDAGDLARL
jgi:hypothetical protein